MKTASKPKPQKSGFVFVGFRHDFAEKRVITVRLMGKPVSVFQRKDGTFYSREMSCKHQGADLSMSPVSGGKVTCSRHGWQYDLTTGRCVNRDSPPLREHPVEVEGDAVFVALFPQS